MRPILIRILIDQPTAWLSSEPAPLAIGSMWVVLAAAAIYLVGRAVMKKPWSPSEREPLVWFGGSLVALLFIAPKVIAPGTSLPIFGYGVMILIGFLAGTLIAQKRLKSLGYDGEIAFSVGTWILIAGICGARLFWLFQHGGEAFGRAPNLIAKLIVIVNLTDGGLVFYGGVFAGLIAFLIYCLLNSIPALRLADVLTPSIFVGVGFGRLGCLMFGCCYGGVCDLPWAITFPVDSIPYRAMIDSGVLEIGATAALHPTQIYSSISGFLLAGLTASFFRHRAGDGAVFALGCMTYPVARFLVEFLRNDELGQLGTSFTMSQYISLGVVVAGGVLFYAVTAQPKSDNAITASAAT